MADTVDTAASLSPADEPEKPPDAASRDEPSEPHDAAPRDEAEEPEDARSLTELLEQLGRDLGDLGKREAELEAARNMPEVRRSARDIAGALVVVVAALTAFAFVNVAALDGLSKVLAPGLAALVIAAVWIAVAGVLLFGLMGRARRWLLWLLLKEPPAKAVDELERERDAAAKAARGTLELLGPALLIRIALAAVPNAGDVADGVVDAGDSVLDASDEIVAEFTEEIPGGGAVRQVWAVALMPGRLGIRVATTVLRQTTQACGLSESRRRVRDPANRDRAVGQSRKPALEAIIGGTAAIPVQGETGSQ
jgi:Putative Actinobacterial Holin-X, holin superfamily III